MENYCNPFERKTKKGFDPRRKFKRHAISQLTGIHDLDPDFLIRVTFFSLWMNIFFAGGFGPNGWSQRVRLENLKRFKK